MDAKQQHERSVFIEFAGAVGLEVAVDSIESRPPPEPDIRCRVLGEACCFELARLLDNEMQRMKIDAWRQHPTPVELRDYDVRLPEREVLRGKLAKKYSTTEPVELLLYYSNESWLVGEPPVIGDEQYQRHAEAVMLPLVRGAASPFRRIWVFERFRRRVLARIDVP